MDDLWLSMRPPQRLKHWKLCYLHENARNAGKLGFSLMRKQKPKTDKAQRQRFIEAAREAGASEDETVFDENLKRIAKAKPHQNGDPEKK
jgi:hypothetical protein